MAEEPKPAARVRFYRFRNKLKDKTAGLSGAASAVSPEALALAQSQFEQMAEDYPDWVQAILVKLYELHARCVDTPDARSGQFEQIQRIAHDLKGQGGTFGYPLITTFASSLNRFTAKRARIADHDVEIIKAHIDAMRAVIRERVKGDGGEIGLALARGLEAVISRYKGM